MPTWLNDLLQEPAAVAIIASSLATSLTFLGGVAVLIINQRSLANKEERRWQHEREIEQDKREQEAKENAKAEKRAEKEYTRHLYYQCIRTINTITSMHGAAYKETVAEAHEWLSYLVLHLGDRDDPNSREFHDILNLFTKSPRDYSGVLYDVVRNLALEEELLFGDQNQSRIITNQEDVTKN